MRSYGLVLGMCIHWMTAAPAPGQERERIAIEVEGGPLWQSRNDVRIPNDDSATRFSLVDVVGNGPYSAFRLEAELAVAANHGLRFVFAPLTVSDTGTAADGLSFAGTAFAPGTLEARYEFSSYRATYRYRFFRGDRWTWKVGGTAFIRDARVALEQDGVTAEDTDVGLVPLLHLQGQTELGERLRFVLDLDGLAASQGRAFDVSAKLAWEVGDGFQLGIGYRTLEGGADVESVFNFAWLHFAVASVRYAF